MSSCSKAGAIICKNFNSVLVSKKYKLIVTYLPSEYCKINYIDEPIEYPLLNDFSNKDIINKEFIDLNNKILLEYYDNYNPDYTIIKAWIRPLNINIDLDV